MDHGRFSGLKYEACTKLAVLAGGKQHVIYNKGMKLQLREPDGYTITGLVLDEEKSKQGGGRENLNKRPKRIKRNGKVDDG